MEWIPCNEKLPEEGEEVLITIRGSDLIAPKDGETLEEAAIRTWNEVCYVTTGFIGEDGWYSSYYFPCVVEPVAWMPMPEPYKGE